MENGWTERIEELEAELSELKQEIQGWKNSRDGVLSQIEDMALQLTEAREEIERLRKALEKALPRMAHRFECVSVLPSEMWKQSGSVSLDSCRCEIKDAQAALSQPDPETLSQIRVCPTCGGPTRESHYEEGWEYCENCKQHIWGVAE